jgi:hypothetical protein
MLLAGNSPRYPGRGKTVRIRLWACAVAGAAILAGGYQQGGDTPSVSYSPRLGRGIQQLYLQAIG